MLWRDNFFCCGFLNLTYRCFCRFLDCSEFLRRRLGCSFPGNVFRRRNVAHSLLQTRQLFILEFQKTLSIFQLLLQSLHLTARLSCFLAGSFRFLFKQQQSLLEIGAALLHLQIGNGLLRFRSGRFLCRSSSNLQLNVFFPDSLTRGHCFSFCNLPIFSSSRRLFCVAHPVFGLLLKL